MVRFSFFLLILALSESTHSSEPVRHGCFMEHVRDAIQINKTRQSLYANLTQNRSRSISRKLIAFEYGIAVSAAVLDFQAKELQELGIPILCDDFISMEEIPSFEEKANKPPLPKEEFLDLSIRSISRRLRKAFRDNFFEGVSRVAEQELGKLSDLPMYHCMVRHFLESILRSSNLAPRYLSQTSDQSLREKIRDLSWNYIQLTIRPGLKIAHHLDQEALTLQSEGIPILCQDVPHIPPY